MTEWKPKKVLPRGAVQRPSALTHNQKAKAALDRLQQPSKAERILWEELKERKLGGFKFVREAEILGWWADFYCAAGRLVIEVDGREHRERRLEDNRRDEVMRANRYRVMRIDAWRVFNDLDRVVKEIKIALNQDWIKKRRDRLLQDSIAALATLGLGVEAEEQDFDPPETQSPVPVKRPVYCRNCRSRFVIDIYDPMAECRNCYTTRALLPVCWECNRRVKTVHSDVHWVCSTCSLIREIAWSSAGRGETEFGDIRDRIGGAKKIL
jgi:very-short-patch-repair endonuclease